jgi:hypothetical protein
MSEIVRALIALAIVANFVVMIASASCNDVNFSFVNPIVIYKKLPVNWFGAALLSIASHVVFPVIAILYWLYKLCTVGRETHG